jgi:hypothetical protein
MMQKDDMLDDDVKAGQPGLLAADAAREHVREKRLPFPLRHAS